MTVDAPDAARLDAAGARAPGPGRRRGRYTARWIAGVALVAIASLVALLATRPPATATEVATPLLGKAAPDLVGTTLSGGRFALSDDRGRWVVVNVSASWCPPCQQEEPALVAFAYHHRLPGEAVLVGVVYDDTTSDARAFATSSGATWPSVVDPGGQIALRYGVRGPPETFVISPAGTVVAHLDGAVTTTDLDQQITAAGAAGL